MVTPGHDCLSSLRSGEVSLCGNWVLLLKAEKEFAGGEQEFCLEGICNWPKATGLRARLDRGAREQRERKVGPGCH